jgi:hypothetical protein
MTYTLPSKIDSSWIFVVIFKKPLIYYTVMDDRCFQYVKVIHFRHFLNVVINLLKYPISFINKKSISFSCKG